MAGINSKGKKEITQLDFDGIKSNLKTYLIGQTEFTDYDFEGSGMSVLLDTLAYNTHYNAFMANMAANEMFLDSTSLRSSAVSHAKMLGYEVSSPRAAKAIITVVLNTTDANKTMPAGTVFTTKIGDVDYQSVSKKVSLITPVPGGVGPMTIAVLMANTLQSFKNLYQ